MSGRLDRRSRLVFSSLSLCAAATLFIVCSDSARASSSPISTQANSEARQNIPSSLFPPSNRHHPLATGRPSPETGPHRGTETESRKSEEAPSTANRQSNPPRFTGGFFSYNPKGPDGRQQSRGGIIRAQRGHSSGGGSLTGHSEQRGQSPERLRSRLHYPPPSQKVTPSGHSYNSNPSAVRGSSQKPILDLNVPRNIHISRVSQPGEYWRNSPSTQRAHHGGYKETNELPAARVWSTSNRIQSSKLFGSGGQTASRAPPTSKALGTSAFRSNPVSQKAVQAPPGRDLSLRPNPTTSGQTQRPKMVRSHLFRDPGASPGVKGEEQQAVVATPQRQRAYGAQARDRFALNSKKLWRNEATEEDSADQLHLAVARTRSQPLSSTSPPAQPPLRPAAGKYPAGSSVSTPRGSARVHKPDRATKSMYGVSGFKYMRSRSGRYSFSEGKLHNNSPSMSSGRIPATTLSPLRPFTSRFKGGQPLLPVSGTSGVRNPDPTQVRSKIMSGSSARPLEGAKPPVRERDRPAKAWQGVNIVSSQTWQPKSSRINRWKNDTESHSGSTQRSKEQSSKDLKIKSEHSRYTPDKHKKKHRIYTFMGFKSPWNHTTAGPPGGIVPSARLRSAAGLQVESGPTTEPRTHDKAKPVAMRARQFHRTHSSTVIGRRVTPKPHRGGKLWESSPPTNRTVEVAIVRPPPLPAKVKADILGSASFGGVGATTQTPADNGDNFPRAPAESRQGEGPGSWTPDDGAQSGKNESSRGKDEVEEKAAGLRSRGFEGGMKTIDGFLDSEGSGAFNAPGVLSADGAQSEGLSEDVMELEHLQTAADKTPPSSQGNCPEQRNDGKVLKCDRQ